MRFCPGTALRRLVEEEPTTTTPTTPVAGSKNATFRRVFRVELLSFAYRLLPGPICRAVR
jgi:hypothetical protein